MSDGRACMVLAAMVVSKEALLVRKAADTSITFVVFLFGVLLSTAVIQLYVVRDPWVIQARMVVLLDLPESRYLMPHASMHGFGCVVREPVALDHSHGPVCSPSPLAARTQHRLRA